MIQPVKCFIVHHSSIATGHPQTSAKEEWRYCTDTSTWSRSAITTHYNSDNPDDDQRRLMMILTTSVAAVIPKYQRKHQHSIPTHVVLCSGKMLKISRLRTRSHFFACHFLPLNFSFSLLITIIIKRQTANHLASNRQLKQTEHGKWKNTK